MKTPKQKPKSNKKPKRENVIATLTGRLQEAEHNNKLRLQEAEHNNKLRLQEADNNNKLMHQTLGKVLAVYERVRNSVAIMVGLTSEEIEFLLNMLGKHTVSGTMEWRIVSKLHRTLTNREHAQLLRAVDLVADEDDPPDDGT